MLWKRDSLSETICHRITISCTGQILAVIFCARIRTKAAINNLTGEQSVMARIGSDMSSEIKEYLEALRNMVQEARLHHEVWWIYKSTETRPKYLDVMNRHLMFFWASIQAHMIGIVTSLYMLYETRKDTRNIPTFMARLKESGLLEESSIRELEALCAQARPLWIKVSILRNNVYAHKSSKHTINDAFELAGVSSDEMIELIDISEKILQKIGAEVLDTHYVFNLSSRRSTIGMLDSLLAYHGLQKP